MQSKLQQLSTLTNVTVSRTAAANGGFTWTVTFNDDGDDFNLEQDGVGVGVSLPDDGGIEWPSSTLTGDASLAGSASLTIKKITAGSVYTSCTGTRAVPSLGGLTKGQMYYTRVFSYNSIGFSEARLAPSPQKPMVIPGPPTGVTLEVVSSYQLKVIFSPPDDNGGDDVTKYLVEWDTNVDFSSANKTTATVTQLSAGAPYFYTIGSLSNKLIMGTYYYIRVKAANSQGYGPTVRSSPESLNPQQAPSAPTGVFFGVTSPSMLTVSWDLPLSDGGDNITSYEVTWDKSPTFNSLELAPHKGTVKRPATERSYTIELLGLKTIYYVKVAAVNSRGAGTPQKAQPQYAAPALMVPGKTVSVSATQGQWSQIVVSWARPRTPHHNIPCFGTVANPTNCPARAGGGDPMSDGGAVIEQYTVQWSEDYTFPSSTSYKVDVTSGTTKTLDHTNGIAPGQTYYIRVFAKNQVGFSAACSFTGDLCTTPAAVIANPASLTNRVVATAGA